ncbi:MAG: maleylacetoacetate isomerase [Bdellovibrionota bacterium]
MRADFGAKELVLYHYWRSSSSWRVRWALECKKLKPQFVHVDLLSGEVDREPHLSRNPMGQVPVLKVDGRHLVESVAIVEWLEEVVPEPLLYKGDAFSRAHIRALCELINAGTQPIQNLNVMDRYSEDPGKRKEWSQFFIRRGLNAFQRLATTRAGTFSVGDSITAADLFLVPQCYNALRFEIDLSEFPLIRRIYENASATTEAKLSAPDNYKL